MFCGRLSLYSRSLFIGSFILLSIFVKSEPHVFIPRDADVNYCEIDGYQEGLSEQQAQDVVCPFPNLGEAMADEKMAQIVAGKNVFQTIENNDVVRVQRDLGFYVIWNPLRDKINQMYKKFFEIAQRDFTLSIATYPVKVRGDTCANHSTIIKVPTSEDERKNLETLEELLSERQEQGTLKTLGVEREISGVFGDYLTVEGRDPRHFELRNDENKNIVICEASKKSLEERMELYCDGEGGECERQMPPLCSGWNENNSQISGKRDICYNLDTFEKVFRKLLLHNMTMNRFCPGDCSYYIQLLQRMSSLEDRICAENHLIVHCGPKKTESRYNLNIKVVDNFCEDFNVMCVPAGFRMVSQ